MRIRGIEMKRKNIPLILMLTSGAITCIITLVRQYEMLERLSLLLGIMALFCLLGYILKWTLDYFDAQNERKFQEEGEVIEKETEENGETGGEQDARNVSGDREA